MVSKPHTLDAASVCEALGVDARRGLSNNRVRTLQEQHGLNQISEQRKKPAWRVLLEQFADPVIYVLASAIVLALLFGEFAEALAVAVVILITVGIGFAMELQAVRSMESLKQMSQVISQVLRNGKITAVTAEQLVPGDILLLREGDLVTADGRLLEADNLRIYESLLTGESFEADKITAPLAGDAMPADQANMVFKGTLVNSGYGKAVVTATGESTLMGHIQKSAFTEEKERTPLEKRLAKLSGILIGTGGPLSYTNDTAEPQRFFILQLEP